MTIRRGGFQARGPRRTTDWGVGPAATDEALTVTGKTLWTTATAPSDNFTLIRTRGYVSVTMNSAGAALDGFVGAHGIYMMTEDAFTVGATAALNPLTQSNSDMWIWHSFFDVRLLTATLADGVNAFAAVSRIEIDSKAMRKDFDPERRMVGVTAVREQGAAVAELFAETRQLFKK